jgi:hypothetical protein
MSDLPIDRRAALTSLLGAALTGCGGGEQVELLAATPSDREASAALPVRPRPWHGFAGNAQHTAVSGAAAQSLTSIVWSAAVDLSPPYSPGGALLAHYGSPVITSENTVIVPVKTTSWGGFRVEARRGSTGAPLWVLASDYLPPAHHWMPSFNPVLAPGPRVLLPTGGGRVLVRDEPDAAVGAVGTLVFYGASHYEQHSALYRKAVRINTPLTCDSQGHVFFGFDVLAPNPLGLTGGFARVAPDGVGTWISADVAAGDGEIEKPQTNAAPALSHDERTLYVVANTRPVANSVAPRGYLIALDADTLAPKSRVALMDPALQLPAWVDDSASASPLVGPDGDVFFGVLEGRPGANGNRGWLMHFDATLSQARIPGSFGWDDTPSVVPASVLPQYGGSSPYLLVCKYNSYVDGQHRMAVLDPHSAQAHSPSALAVMREVITILSPSALPGVPGHLHEWCVNTCAVDPRTASVFMNNSDGHLYRWHLPSNSLTERRALNPGYFQSYTPTAIGPDGRVYAVNNATLSALGL